jgi:hypothetical protein
MKMLLFLSISPYSVNSDNFENSASDSCVTHQLYGSCIILFLFCDGLQIRDSEGQ